MTLYRLVKFTRDDHIIVELLTSNEENHIEIISTTVTIDTGFDAVRVASKENLIKRKIVRSSQLDLYDIKRLKGERDDES